jgi:general secretion pathway protein I
MAQPLKAKAGFTLIETLIALMLIAMAGTALVALRAQTVRATAMLQEQSYAQIVADTIASEEWLDRSGTVDAETGIERAGGRDWFWQTRYVETGRPGLYQLVVEVRASEAERVLVHRELLRVTGQ